MSIFNNLFKAKKLAKPLGFEQIAVDMHSHLIPGIDDGVKSLEESLGLIRKMVDMGYKKLITTPHIQTEFYQNTPEIILSGLDSLRKAVKNAGIPVELEAGAEYLIDDGFAEKIKNGKLLTFGSNFILVELSYYAEPPYFKEMIFELQTNGYKVILAHPERYTYWFNKPSKYEDLIDRSVYLQLNTISLSGYYGPDIKRVAEQLTDNKMISFIGSDMHNMNYMQGLDNTRFEIYLQKVMETNQLQNFGLL